MHVYVSQQHFSSYRSLSQGGYDLNGSSESYDRNNEINVASLSIGFYFKPMLHRKWIAMYSRVAAVTQCDNDGWIYVNEVPSSNHHIVYL